MPIGAGTTPPRVCKTPLKLDLTENSPAKMSVGVEIPRVSAQSEIFSGFRLSPRRRTWVFKLQYIGGRLFFYTTVAVSLLCETGQVRIRAESPPGSVERAEGCKSARSFDSRGVPVGALFGTSRKSGGPAQFRPGKRSKLEAKLRGKPTIPA